MRCSGKVLLVITLLLPRQFICGAPAASDSMTFEVLLSQNMFEDVSRSEGFIGNFAITSDRLILLSSPGQFYLLGWGGMSPAGKSSSKAISSFAYTPDSLLMVVRNNELCYMDSSGDLSSLFTLPKNGMGICTGSHVMYLFDRNEGGDRHAIYMLAGGGRYAKLLELPDPINTVVEYNNSLLISAGNGLLQYDLSSKEIKAVTALPEGSMIKSVTVDPVTGRLYISSVRSVYALKDNMLIPVSLSTGGSLGWLNGLIVFDPGKQLLVRITGIEKALSFPVAVSGGNGMNKASGTVGSESVNLSQSGTTGQAQPTNNASGNEPDKDRLSTSSVQSQGSGSQSPVILTNSSIIDLAGNGLSDILIINIINRSVVNFDLDVDAMVELSQRGVSSKVIQAMRQAAGKQ